MFVFAAIPFVRLDNMCLLLKLLIYFLKKTYKKYEMKNSIFTLLGFRIVVCSMDGGKGI